MVSFGPSFSVEVVDPVSDYLAALQAVFDFPALKRFVARPGFGLRFDALHAVTGPYGRRIFVVRFRLILFVCLSCLFRGCYAGVPAWAGRVPVFGLVAHAFLRDFRASSPLRPRAFGPCSRTPFARPPHPAFHL